MTTPIPLVILRRGHSSQRGTPGILTYLGNTTDTLELPWHNNAVGISCIPTGIYFATFAEWPMHQPRYLLHSVPGRTGIRIHAGNRAGALSQAYKTDSQGCILLGTAGYPPKPGSDQQHYLTKSRPAMEHFENTMKRCPFQIIITSPDHGQNHRSAF